MQNTRFEVEDAGLSQGIINTEAARQTGFSSFDREAINSARNTAGLVLLEDKPAFLISNIILLNKSCKF
jgi:hypothetical protein